MKSPQNLAYAEQELAATFELIAGRRPTVLILPTRDEKGRVVVSVGYRGDHLVEAMQIEAFITQRGESVRYRSQLKEGNTVLVYNMESTR
jgi:hypothetical protein